MPKLLRPGQAGAPEAVLTHKLSKPIKDFEGDDLAEITFREPTAGDITRVGDPIKFMPFTDPPEVTFNEQKMTAMLAHLSNVTPAMVERMSAQDWKTCAWGIARFFMPAL